MVDLDKSYRDMDFSVLIADDQKFMLKNLERYFSKYFNVLTASTLDEGINHLNTARIATVISDHQMADGQGIALLEYIRENHPAVRKIVITADRHEQTVIDLMSAQLAHSFVFKPTVKPQLHQAVAEQSEIFLRESE